MIFEEDHDVSFVLSKQYQKERILQIKLLYSFLQSSATIVVLMGMRFLKEIIRAFGRHKPEDYPVAIIQNGTTTAEKVVLGTLGTIEQEVITHSISNPANIIFGPAVLDQITQYKNLKSTLCYQ